MRTLSYFKTKKIFIGKSRNRRLIEISAGGDNLDFDGIIVLLGMNANGFFYVPGHVLFTLTTEDKIIDLISYMGNKMIPYTIAVGEKITYILFDPYEFIELRKS